MYIAYIYIYIYFNKLPGGAKERYKNKLLLLGKIISIYPVISFLLIFSSNLKREWSVKLNQQTVCRL